MIGFQQKQDVILRLPFGTLKPAINHKIKITQIAFAFPEKPQSGFIFFKGEKNNTLPLAHGRSKPPLEHSAKVFFLPKLTRSTSWFADPLPIMDVNFAQLMKRSRLPTSIHTVKCGFSSCGAPQSVWYSKLHGYNYKQEY